jgi:hypothetical protein
MKIQDTQPTNNSALLSEGFRLTSFFHPSGRMDHSQWWETVVGEMPEKRNSQPKTGVFQDEGPYAGGYLILSIQPGRADWLFFPSFDNQIGMPIFQELPPYQLNKDLFLQVMNRWFEICPPIRRVAFGLILNIPVPDRPTGYRELSKCLSKIQIDSDNSTDLLYQINRRRISKNIPDLSLNRLSKWAVAVIESIRIPADGVSPVVAGFQQSPYYFVRLELDVNTAQEYNENIPNEKYMPLLSELLELAFEIAENGDIA